jgi:TetR/AcrR family transcriptional regulator
MQKSKEAKSIFYKDTFNKTTEERRNRIIDAAVKEFSENGYNAASIKTIVKKSGISIGALYSYFSSKEDLFLTVVDEGFKILESVYEACNEREDLFAAYGQLLRTVSDLAPDYTELYRIYLDITSHSLSSMSKKLSNQLEPISVEFYKNMIAKTKEKGLIRNALNEDMAAFLLDNIVLMYMFSFSSDYYMQRMRFFLGDVLPNDQEQVIGNIMKFVRKMLA